MHHMDKLVIRQIANNLITNLGNCSITTMCMKHREQFFIDHVAYNKNDIVESGSMK